MTNRVVTHGACLRPGALPHLTRLPASDFTDQSTPVEAVLGAHGRSLMERFGGPAACGGTPLDTIAAFLAELWTRRDRRAGVPLEGCNRVAELAAETGLPVRTLHARLTQDVGLSPKRILRIQRLHRTLKLAQDRSCAWPSIAASAGFADQAHMIREFVDLLGESPTAWRQRSPLPISSIPRATLENTLVGLGGSRGPG